MTFPHYWPSTSHALRWMPAGVSIVPYYKWVVMVSLLSVGRIIHQEIQGLATSESRTVGNTTPSPIGSNDRRLITSPCQPQYPLFQPSPRSPWQRSPVGMEPLKRSARC